LTGSAIGRKNRTRRASATPGVGKTRTFPNQFVYAFLELARYYFLRDHNAEDVRLGETKERAEMLFHQAVASDSEGSEDRDMALLPSTEHGIHRMLDSDDIRWETL
jgi:hypothetical protein